jgi:four helix bundle protein
MRDHTKLRAFRLADELAVAIYAHTREFPVEERFGLTAQLRRGAISIASNIVEGCARPGETEYVHYLSVAYGAARELDYQLSLARRLGYLSAEQYEPLSTLSVEACKVLTGLIRSLKA